MKSLYKYILSLYAILCCNVVLGASEQTFRSLSISDGMTDLVVNSIYKDKSGFIWFGTNSSVEKFDGVRLKKYNLDAFGNNKKRVYTILESQTQGLLCGTGGGICRLDTLTDSLVRVYQDEISCKVNSLFSYSADTLLAATDEGVYVCTLQGVRKSRFGDGVLPDDNTITGIVPAAGGRHVWLSSKNGVIWYDPSTDDYSRYVCDNKELSNSFYNIVALGDTLYLGTMDRGLMYFDVRNHKFGGSVDVGCSVVSSLSSDGGDLLYVGTDGNGVHFVSAKRQKVVKSYRHVPGKDGGIRSNSVYSVLVDRDGLLWISLYQIGVDYTLYQSGLFDVYEWKGKFSTKDLPVRTIAFNGSQRLIGSRDGLAFVDEDRDIVKYYSVPALRANMIISSCYHNGSFYIGTYGGGMYILNPETLELKDFTWSDDEVFTIGHIFAIRPDSHGCLWVGTSSGLYCFSGGKVKHRLSSSYAKIPDGNIYEIFFDSQGRGWVCAETGVCQLDPKTDAIRTEVFPQGYINNEKIRAIYESKVGNLYFLPEKGKVFRTNLAVDEYEYIDDIPILDGKQSLSMVEDDRGGMFITTNNGLYCIDSTKNVIPYNFTDGIPNPIFTNCTAVRDSSGMYWFGNSKGLVRLGSDNINNLRNHGYNMEISGVLVNGKVPEKQMARDNSGNYSLEIGDSYNNIQVLFSGLVYSAPSYMIYEYSIGDADKWIPLHGLSEISLYDVNDDMMLKIRRAGYPDSQITLSINMVRNNTLLLSFMFFIVVCVTGLFMFRRWIISFTIGNLKKFIAWLQSAEKHEEEHEIEEEHEELLEEETETHTESTEDKYKNYKLSDEECKRLLKIIAKEMSKNKLYKNPSLKIGDLAKVAGSTSYALSYVFNQYLQKSYYDYINEYRVEEFKSAIAGDKYHKYTLETLASHCGFSSRASFFRAFKKVTGITPNEYIKNMKSAGDETK